MGKTVAVRGRLTDASHIELDEPVTDLVGPVDIVLRKASTTSDISDEDIFEFIAKLPGGARSKADIDEQIRGERGRWADR